MRLLISTPCSGGMLYEQYVSSLLVCVSRAVSEGILTGFQVHFQGKESLIHRARDRAAMFMLENDFDKMITIDADIRWTYDDFKRIITSDKQLIGGVYPLKTFPVVLNFNPLPGKGDELFTTTRGIDYEAFEKFKAKYADPVTGLAEVQHLPTGFLCATREVFERLGEVSDFYDTLDASTGTRKRYMHFYESGVHEGQLESEDWNFVRRVRELGISAHFDTKVIVAHVGNHEYSLGQVFGEIAR
jgi:hypothetical protein